MPSTILNKLRDFIPVSFIFHQWNSLWFLDFKAISVVLPKNAEYALRITLWNLFSYFLLFLFIYFALTWLGTYNQVLPFPSILQLLFRHTILQSQATYLTCMFCLFQTELDHKTHQSPLPLHQWIHESRKTAILKSNWYYWITDCILSKYYHHYILPN